MATLPTPFHTVPRPPVRPRPPGLRRASAALSAVAVLTVAACSSGGSPGPGGSSTGSGSIVVGRDAAVATWEGDQCGGPQIQTNPMVYDTLLRMQEPDGQGIVSGIAESWEYDEAASAYTFVLRETGFSNGDPVTAADVAFSFEQWKAGEFSGAYYQTIGEVEAVDDRTVRVAMTQPDTFLPALLTWCTSTVYPEDFAGEDPEEFFRQPIGAGPYAVSEYTDLGGPSETITLTRNEHYWGAAEGLPATETIVLRTIADANLRALAFESGELSILEDVDSATRRQLDEDLVVATDPMRMRGIVVNTSRPLLSDPRLRHAISLAVDREALVAALDDFASPNPGGLVVNVPGAVEPTEPNRFDLDEARALVAAVPGAQGASFDYLYDPADGTEATIAQVLQDQLAQIGITITLVGSDFGAVRAAKNSGDFDLAMGSTSAISPDIFDPIGVFVATNYPNAKADLTVVQEQFLIGTSTSDPAERERAVQLIMDDIQEQAAVIGLINSASTYAVAADVEGFTALPYGVWYPESVRRGG